MAPHQHLPVIRIQDICTPLRAEVFSIFRHEDQGRASLPQPHKHDFYMLLAVSSGSGTHTIDFTPYPVTPGSMFFLAPGQPHDWELAPGTKGFQLMFGRDFLPGDTLQWPFFSFSANPHLQLAPVKFAAVLQELESILEEYALADYLSVRIISYRLLALLTMLERLYGESHPSGNQLPVQRLDTSYFSRFFRRYTGQTPLAFRQQVQKVPGSPR